MDHKIVVTVTYIYYEVNFVLHWLVVRKYDAHPSNRLHDWYKAKSLNHEI